MEALLFMLNSFAMVVMIYMGLRDDRRPPGTPRTSVFRMTEDGVLRPDQAAKREREARIARSRRT